MTARHPKTPLSVAPQRAAPPFGRGAAVLALAVVGLSLGGAQACGQGAADSTSEPLAGESSAVASVALALEVGSTVEIDTVHYDISGGTFHKAGTIDVSHSSGAAALIDSVPFGMGYVATLTASSTAPVALDCSGAATFDLTAAGITAVPVHVTCKEAPTTPPPPPPPPVPIPRSAMGALTALLLAAGLALLGRTLPSARREGRSG